MIKIYTEFEDQKKFQKYLRQVSIFLIAQILDTILSSRYQNNGLLTKDYEDIIKIK